MPILDRATIAFKRGISILFAAAALFPTTTIFANQIVPNGFDTIAGGANDAYPFFSGQEGQSSQRYQQVYNSDQFSNFGTGQYITELAFRPVSVINGTTYNDSVPTLQVSLSTTSYAADGLSTVFSTNITGTPQVVYDGAWSVTGNLASGVNPFDIVLPLQTPFFYDPNSGNLLLDVSIAGGTGTQIYVDARNASDGVSRVYNFDATASTAIERDTLGIITDFVTESSVPEPTSMSLLTIGLVGLFHRHRRRGSNLRSILK
jgi:hypothetical protein